MKIGIYISELLFDHEAVVLNGFGEFYTRYNPARFVPEMQKVESPSKTIAFNPGKQEGDSPLLAHISKKEKMEAGQVEKYLADYVAEVKQVLEAGKKFEMEKVGIFSTAPDGDLVFEPDTSVNYLTDAVGMPPVKEPEKPVAKASEEGKQHVTPVTPIPLAEEKSPPAGPPTQAGKQESPELPSALKWLAYTVVPLLVIIIILALNFNFFFGEGGLFSSSEKSPAPTELTTPPVAATDLETETEAEAEAAVDESETAPAQPARTETAPATQPTSPEAAPATPEAGRTVYYIVVGSFPDRETAEGLAERLRGQGASQASVFMQTATGYHRVAYGFFYDLAEAERLLPTVKENVSQEAYILHR